MRDKLLCPHRLLTRQLSGSYAWYCCKECGTKFLPHHRDTSIPIWDGKLKVKP